MRTAVNANVLKLRPRSRQCRAAAASKSCSVSRVCGAACAVVLLLPSYCLTLPPSDNMNSERAGVGSEPPQLPGPHQLPPHQLLGLAGLVAGAGMGSNVASNMNMNMHNPMTSDSNTSPSPSVASRSLPGTPTSSVSGLMSGVGGPSRPPTLPQALLNMDGGTGMPWGGWADLQDSMGMERGRSRNWTYEETVELISMYTSDEWQSKFSSEKKNHRAIWASLAAALTRRKDVSGDEARQRLNNLKALYNRTRRQLLAGEISSPQWEYWEPLHAFLGRPQPYIPITSAPTQPRPPPLHGFSQHQYQPHAPHPHHQGLLGALGFPQHMAQQPTDNPPRPFMKTSPEVKFEETTTKDSEYGLPAPEDRGSSDFVHNNADEVPVAVSPEHFLAETSEREPTPTPPTPTPQKPESYQLRHNNHLTIVLEALARDESFMDVTLTAQGRSLKAHKSVLSAVSPYFRGVLRDNPCQHPIIIMPRDVRFEELFSIVNYIYKGEMTVAAEDLTSLLKTAEILQVSGLAPSDSSATVNPHTDCSATGNARSSSASSSSSSSNLPSVSRTSRLVKTPTHQMATPPARPKSRDSMINPTDFMDVDMTCVKEEVESADDEENEEQISKESSLQTPGNVGKGDQALQQSLSAFSPSHDAGLEQPIASTSSTHDTAPSPLPIKSDPETDINSQANLTTEDPHPFVCPHCQEHHRDRETMITHLRVRHPTKPSFTCGCGRVYTRQMHHQAHVRVCSSSP
nr:uncharacterized protein LOC123757808 isoform X1 [Procambarus clarkii]